MEEQLKKALKKWKNNYLKEKRKLEKKYPYIENQLNNKHPINELNKKYFEEKRKIIEKYNSQNK